ncbi:hypothetical protein [Cylindrospermopsis curvispora]|uniref:hypothetical protein n=1 Tax=Cylindrospermopsis curvispora TaxID=747548 RepID=UPI001F453467|nr:hypothetical protein [Cylindrospermopsis curvispora]
MEKPKTGDGRLRSTPYGRSHCIPYESSHSGIPLVPSQGKNLNVLRGDCITPPTGDRKARSPLGTFHVPFPVGKRLTENVYRQRMNQLFQGGRDIWRGIAKHSLWEIAKHTLRVIAKHTLRVIAQHSLWEIAKDSQPGDCLWGRPGINSRSQSASRLKTDWFCRLG